MVSFDSIKEQLNLLGIDLPTVADKAFCQKGECEKTKHKLKRWLTELFGRRNIIAHQTDREHTNAQIKNITKEIVQDFIVDVEKIVHSINEAAKNKQQ